MCTNIVASTGWEKLCHHETSLEFNYSNGSSGLSVVLLLITLSSVIIITINFILNNKVSNGVVFSCTDKEKINKPKEELVLSAEDGKYHLCLHGSLLLFQWFCLLVKFSFFFSNQELYCVFRFV